MAPGPPTFSLGRGAHPGQGGCHSQKREAAHSRATICDTSARGHCPPRGPRETGYGQTQQDAGGGEAPGEFLPGPTLPISVGPESTRLYRARLSGSEAPCPNNCPRAYQSFPRKRQVPAQGYPETPGAPPKGHPDHGACDGDGFDYSGHTEARHSQTFSHNGHQQT